MAENSKIAWTDHTFNPWIGCTKVSLGCKNCYAEHLMDTRFGRAKWGPGGTRVRTSEANWKLPLKWNAQAKEAAVRARVFCASLADVFEDWRGPIEQSNGAQIWIRDDGTITSSDHYRDTRALTLNDLRRDLFALIDATPWLDWLLLTKRPENIQRLWVEREPDGTAVADLGITEMAHVRQNIWLGASIESMEQAERWSYLAERRYDVPVLWVSAEPLLVPLDVSALVHHGRRPDWIVFGGESAQGAPARPCDIEWIRAAVEQCRELGVKPFVKQLGSQPRFLDRAGANPDEWPEDVRIREFPIPGETR